MIHVDLDAGAAVRYPVLPDTACVLQHGLPRTDYGTFVADHERDPTGEVFTRLATPPASVIGGD
jgi:hypothetical protein